MLKKVYLFHQGEDENLMLNIKVILINNLFSNKRLLGTFVEKLIKNITQKLSVQSLRLNYLFFDQNHGER